MVQLDFGRLEHVAVVLVMEHEQDVGGWLPAAYGCLLNVSQCDKGLTGSRFPSPGDGASLEFNGDDGQRKRRPMQTQNCLQRPGYSLTSRERSAVTTAATDAVNTTAGVTVFLDP